MTTELDNLNAPPTPEELLALSRISETPQYADVNGEVRDHRTGRIVDGGDGPDNLLNVSFMLMPVLNRLATHRAGKPQFTDVEMIVISAPGEVPGTTIARVDDYYKWRFPLDYETFKKGQGELLTGTPLSVWPALGPSEIKMLEQVGVRTVEQLAGLSDTHSASIRGFHSLKAKAAQFLSAANDKAAAGALQAELDAMKAQMAEMMKLVQAKAEPAVEVETAQEEATSKKKYGAK